VDVTTELLPFGFDSGATLSDCGRYRYRLWRIWGDAEHRVCFVMVNPSTADACADDATIRKCTGFAKRWGFGALDVVNLFAWRSTDVTALLRTADPVGPKNDEHIAAAIGQAHRVVWAWGKHNAAVQRLIVKRTEGWSFSPKCDAGTLGLNGDGSPRHPLMLPYATTAFERQQFPPPRLRLVKS
jgi:hypothetical protein